jgi:zinc protease
MRALRAECLPLTILVLCIFSACLGIPGRDASVSPQALSAAPSPKSASSPAASIAPSLSSGKDDTGARESDFYKSNIASLSTRTLDNGIPVVIKSNPANRVFALKVILRGTAVLTSPAKAGIESVTLQTMARGSKRYSYDALTALAYYRSSAIATVSSSYDYSSFDLVTFDKYFDETFDAFSSCFTEPTLLEADFRTALNGFRASHSQAMADPYNFATAVLHQAEFKDHPYAADPAGTDSSIASLTLEDAKAHYASLIVPERMAIVAVGNFDETKLMGQLNAAFGKLPASGLKIPETKRHEAKRDLILAPFPSSPGVAYVRGDYPAPKPTDKDWTAYSLSSMILSELLFNVVRNKYGACYTPFSNVYGFQNPYGSVGIYKTSVPAEVKSYIDEAIGLLADGKTPNLKGLPGIEYANLSDTLEAYKAKYVNVFYSKQQTNIEVAGQIAASLVAYGQAEEYLKLIDKLKPVKADDVAKAAKKYLVEGKTSWIVVTDQAGLDSVRKDDWLKFLPAKK